MIYSLINNRWKKVNYLEVPKFIKKLWKSRLNLSDYYFYYDKIQFWTIGFMKNENQYCVIDFNSNYNNSIKSLKILISVLDRYSNVYCVPNKKGALIWKSLNWESRNLYIKPFFKWRYKKYIYNSKKYFFLNLFLILDYEAIFPISRKIYYKGIKPKLILIDTF